MRKRSGLFNSITIIGFLSAALAGCGGSLPAGVALESTQSGPSPSLATLSGDNVLPVAVNGSLCSAATSVGYPNKPCVSVTVCDPTGANCTTINDILVDTGSYGFRVFKSVLQQQNPALASALTPVTNKGLSIAECTQFGDGSSDWGPIEMATVMLGKEAGVKVPIQVIDSSFVGSSTNCGGASTDPVDAGYNGILGVGLFANDCGDSCANQANNGVYFKCTGSACSGVIMPIAQQVTNPVAALSKDNNGVILELPSVPAGGAASASGYLVLGIDTESNNAPSNVTAYVTDPSTGEFSTTFSGQAYPSSFLDSGSNGLYFDAPSTLAKQLPNCSAQDPNSSDWYCPSSTLNLSATSTGNAGPAGASEHFQIGNYLNLMNTSNNVFAELGGTLHDGHQAFDWGLPFYYGRSVYVGFDGKTSKLASGPYWAF